MATVEDPPIEERLTPQERTVSYVLNSLSGAFQSTKAAIHNVEHFLYANPLEVSTQDVCSLFGKQAGEVVGICDSAKVFLAKVQAFLAAAHTEVVAAQPESAKAAELAQAVKTMASDEGAIVKDQKPVDVRLDVNPDGSVTVSASEQIIDVKP